MLEAKSRKDSMGEEVTDGFSKIKSNLLVLKNAYEFIRWSYQYSRSLAFDLEIEDKTIDYM